MTNTSLEELHNFLVGMSNEGRLFKEMRVADYGGTVNIGEGLVEKMLKEGGITDYNMLDFDNGIDLREPIKGEKFDMGICMDLLEHVSNPFTVTRNIIDSLKPGAPLFVAVPFVWEIHPTPQDFWRFTPDGLNELFKDDMEVRLIYAEHDSYRPPEPNPFPTIPPVTLPWTHIFGVFIKK